MIGLRYLLCWHYNSIVSLKCRLEWINEFWGVSFEDVICRILQGRLVYIVSCIVIAKGLQLLVIAEYSVAVIGHVLYYSRQVDQLKLWFVMRINFLLGLFQILDCLDAASFNLLFLLLFYKINSGLFLLHLRGRVVVVIKMWRVKTFFIIGYLNFLFFC